MKPLEPAGTKVAAAVSTDTLVLNNKQTKFPAYNIAGYNWLKLRDVAALLNGTKKQFAVDWNAGTNTVSITTGKAYTTIGDELRDIAGGYTAVSSPQTILVDGKVISIAAYNINGYNYVRLRDIAILLDFGVNYNSSGIITLDLDTGYKE